MVRVRNWDRVRIDRESADASGPDEPRSVVKRPLATGAPGGIPPCFAGPPFR